MAGYMSSLFDPWNQRREINAKVWVTPDFVMRGRDNNYQFILFIILLFLLNFSTTEIAQPTWDIICIFFDGMF